MDRAYYVLAIHENLLKPLFLPQKKYINYLSHSSFGTKEKQDYHGT